jgi:hypothetical protein
LKGRFRDLANVFWPAVEAQLDLSTFKAKLGGDDDLLSYRTEGLARSFSLSKGPYASAVSKKVTPPSYAARITLIASYLPPGRNRS